jgi:acyl-CoA dehydrogenase
MTFLKPVAEIGPLERAQPAIATAADHANDVDRNGRFPSEAIEQIRSSGLLAAAIPTDLGGEGASLSDLCAIAKALGGSCASTGMIFAMHQICLLNLLDCALDSAWHRDLIKRLAVRPLLFASATTEAGVGGDLRQSICAIENTAEKISLIKIAPVISYGEQADAIFATARRDAQTAFSDQVLVVLLRSQCELERISTWDALGMRGTCGHGYRLKAEAKPEQVVPKPFADIAADSMVAASHLLWSSVWCGIAAAAFERAQNYVAAGARTNDGQPPAGAARLADAFMRLCSVEAAIASVLAEWERARSRPTLNVALSVNALKLLVSTTSLEIVDEALLICGIHGYSNNGPYSLGRHLRDIHSARLMIGNDRIAVSTGQMLLMQRRSKPRPI